MKLNLTLDDAKYACAVAKEQGDTAKADANITARVNEYLDACERDVGASDLANVLKEIQDPAKLATAKAALNL